MSDTPQGEHRGRGGFRLWMLVPALGAASVMAVFLLGLERENPDDLPSTRINKPAPEFSLPPLFEGQPGFSKADLTKPGVKLVNIWASWCVPCRAEAPELEKLAEMGITIHGIDYKDKPEDAKRFLEDLGNPYALIGADRKGRAGIEWGAYGVPETFVVNGEGTVVYKHIGPIQGSDLEKRILPAIEDAKG